MVENQVWDQKWWGFWRVKDTRIVWGFELVLRLKLHSSAVGSPWRKGPVVHPGCWSWVEVLEELCLWVDLGEMLEELCVWVDLDDCLMGLYPPQGTWWW